ncbi:hypothetical protein [Priestia megaterium]|uniref:hypothetical protein n=1 Tax=Priestia megaterium TaxID=1404 RepID=UPI002E1A3DB3|nr:hypothetical protein [Priestia megaterium]
MSNPTLKNSFYTKEKNIEFRIQVNCKIELLDANLQEIIDTGKRRPHDRAIYGSDGSVDLRDSLNSSQKQIIKNEISRITQNNPSYCIEQDIIQLSRKHVVKEYCEDNPQKLIDRGWPPEEDDLILEVIEILCNISDIKKAKLKFREDGKSHEKLTYTVTGEHKGYIGTLAVGFQSEIKNDKGSKETIVTVTVLKRKEKKQV